MKNMPRAGLPQRASVPGFDSRGAAPIIRKLLGYAAVIAAAVVNVAVWSNLTH